MLVLATALAGAVLIWRGSVATWIWRGLAIAWAVVLLEREIVQENGGLWSPRRGWLGIIVGARRAGINRWALPLLAYPLLSAAIVIAAGQELDRPVGQLLVVGARRARPGDRGANAGEAASADAPARG